jgi:5'-nucleotidase
MRPQNRTGKGVCFQVNAGVKAVYNDKNKNLESLHVKGEPVDDNKAYSVCLQGYHFNNSWANLNISRDELLALGISRVVTTSTHDVLDEYLRNNQNAARRIEGRLIYKK